MIKSHVLYQLSYGPELVCKLTQILTILEKKDNLISNTRLFSQKIAATEFKTAKEIVSWMGAVQAQDYAMAKWAVGLRLSDSTDEMVESSFNKGEIIRIHALRPTWHFVSPDDIYWIINLTAHKILSSLKSRHKQLELSESVIIKSTTLIEKELGKGTSLTREEIADELHKIRIKTDANRLSHLLFCAELEGIICSGPVKSKKHTYSLLSSRVPFKKELSRDESIAELAKRYFTSHCPATIQDFSWWSNLSLNEIRKAIASVKSEFITDTTVSGQYLYPISFSEPPAIKNPAYLLPAFDEFLISYKDRSSSLSLIHNRKAVSDNGIFYPPVVVNGQVAGIWQRTIQNDKVIVTFNLFQRLNKSLLTLIEKKAVQYGKFLDKETLIQYKTKE